MCLLFSRSTYMHAQKFEQILKFTFEFGRKISKVKNRIQQVLLHWQARVQVPSPKVKVPAFKLQKRGAQFRTKGCLDIQVHKTGPKTWIIIKSPNKEVYLIFGFEPPGSFQEWVHLCWGGKGDYLNRLIPRVHYFVLKLIEYREYFFRSFFLSIHSCDLNHNPLIF